MLDNPLLAATGHAYAGVTPPDSENSPTTLYANLKWAAGGDASSYSIRYRPLLSYDEHRHSSESWQLTDSVLGAWGSGANVRMAAGSGAGTRTARIEFLSRGAVYAIQLNFEEKLDPTCQDTQASPCPTRPGFSGRYAYVWASDTRPDGGGNAPERVATYPYYGYFQSKEYNYRICTNTFPHEILEPFVLGTWINMVDKAIGTWQEAASNLITTTRVSATCEDPEWVEEFDLPAFTCDADTGLLGTFIGGLFQALDFVAGELFLMGGVRRHWNSPRKCARHM